MCQFSSTDQEELETDSTVREILDDTNEEVQDVDNILFDMFSQTTKIERHKNYNIKKSKYEPL